MTDRTQPEAGSIHIIRYALEMGLLWVDGDGRDKVREALDALDALEAKLASIGAGGVQALSAAPAGWKLVPLEPSVDQEWAGKIVSLDDITMGEACRIYKAMLAASPTPPAEQQATKETSGGFHVWRDISTAPKDGSRFVAIGYNYGLYSEGRHICVAQWFRGCWMEPSDWNDASELTHLTHWMPLPSPPDDVAAPAEQQAAPKAAPQQKAHYLTQALTDPENQPNQYGVEFGMSGQQMHFKIGNQLFRLAYEPDDHQEFEFMKRMLIHAFSTFTPDVKAAPQQEAQEPVAWRLTNTAFRSPKYEYFTHKSHAEVRQEQFNRSEDDGGLHNLTPLYTAPQPAPAPLSEREVFEATWEKAHGKKPVLWETMFAQQKQEIPPHCVGRYFYRDAQTAWKAWQARAALAAQGGKE